MNKLNIIIILYILCFRINAQIDGAPSFAFKIDSVSFSNGPVRLGGAILKPEGDGPFPAVVIVHGAGPATFDEPAFRVHANSFVRGGFAVLLYDKRGSGKSTGSLDTSDYDDLAADLSAGVRYLRSCRFIIPDKIGILGRSEGGWIGTLTASRDSLIRFVILSSGSGVPPYAQTLFATKKALELLGASVQEIEAATDVKSALWEYYSMVAGMDSTTIKSVDVKNKRDLLEKRLRSFAHFSPEIPQIVRDPANTPLAFFRAFTNKINYDPAHSFENMHASLLVVIGEDDNVVDPVTTIAVFEHLRQRGRDVTVRTLKGVGHSLIFITNEGPSYPKDYPEFAVRWAQSIIDGIKE